MKRTLALGIILFLGALGALTGHKLSSESLAVIVGVVLGVVAVIPLVVLVLVVVRKSMQQPAVPQQPANAGQQPTVIVVGGQQLPGPQQEPWVDGQWRPAEDQPTFRMLGED